MRSRALAIGLLLLATLSCTGTTKDKMLRLLFDDPPGAVASVVADTAVAASGAATMLPPGLPTGVNASKPSGSIHPPYEEDDCSACHTLSSSASFRRGPARAGAASPKVAAKPSHGSALLALAPEVLCFDCHDDMTSDELEAQGDVVHAPAADGECLECHDPHKSRLSFLLREEDPFETLCFSCHESEDVLGTDTHGDLEPEERTCTKCHDPHVSTEEYLLRM